MYSGYSPNLNSMDEEVKGFIERNALETEQTMKRSIRFKGSRNYSQLTFLTAQFKPYLPVTATDSPSTVSLSTIALETQTVWIIVPTFQNNQCSGGHGISVGSISAGKTVTDVTISGNTVTNSMYGLRYGNGSSSLARCSSVGGVGGIKVKADTTSVKISGITYSSNTVSGITKYGVLIFQSYPDDAGTPARRPFDGPCRGRELHRHSYYSQVRDNVERLTIGCEPLVATEMAPGRYVPSRLNASDIGLLQVDGHWWLRWNCLQ
ncbi:uncharacterized protein BT62DRAFT_921601 [Guyanagaster necrorhizus]|uniref:endo-polygalacturonase n=1 Tax=Guyanagaster necrorhizus TaxID=856835 RepID=A0A9P7VNZ8_9AGAR|nr:uncharacterized protein BT62DRAFT_921601 [Guyanagaster necrorhizus MCA 3950]KAG7443967.1 hypothetical protein BT62DRAFT_921601 [Guyanagaster necrorhizus MCA 3950]